MTRRYSDLIALPTFEERYKYLQLLGKVGDETFGFERYLNQVFYRSDRWKAIRNQVIIRDNGCDLGITDRIITGRFVVIHHMNPITVEDIKTMSSFLVDPEFLICCSDATHKAIHYGDANLLIKDPVIRMPNDTCPWRN